MSAVTIDHLLVPVRVRPARPAVVIPFPVARARRSARNGPRLHITRRGRLTLTLLVVLAVSVAAVAAITPSPARGAGAAEGTSASELRHVVVTPGDTLWRIASSAAGEGQDVRDVIADIRDLNGLETSAVMAGQQLLVPVTT